MSYALIQNNEVVEYPVSIGNWRVENPNICLPAVPTEQQLNEQGIYTVLPTQKPSYDAITQSCSEDNPVKMELNWVQAWKVTQNTPEQILANEQASRQKNKKTAEDMLSATDWTQVADVPLLNKQDFTDYRASVRAIALNPPVQATFPELPAEQWN